MTVLDALPRRPRGLLIDLDGTVYEGDEPIPGAAAAIASLRASGLSLRFLTNTTRLPRRELAARLETFGIPVTGDEIFTAPLAAAAWIREADIRRTALCLPAHTAEDFPGVTIVDTNPEAVVVGDLGTEWTFERVNQAFRWLLAGARLIALHRNRYWQTPTGLTVDAGAYVAALEYAAGVEAVLVGKPHAPMFLAAAASMNLAMADVAVVGDDIVADVEGGKHAGASGVLVRTGKFRLGRVNESAADLVVASIAALSQ